MTEQTTIRAIAELGRDWGPLWTTAFLFVVWNLFQSYLLKKKDREYSKTDKTQDEEITKLRVSKGKILDELGNLRVELEKRITYNWMEAKILPKIDALTETVNKLSVIVDRDQNNMQLLTTSLVALQKSIEQLNKRYEQSLNK